MFSFTQIPQAGAPLGEPVLYAVAGDSSGEIRLRLLTGAGEQLCAKCFCETGQATADMAPALRRRLRFGAPSGRTGFRSPADRFLEAYAEARITLAEGETRYATAPMRRFLPCAAAPDVPSLLTTMPFERLIGPGERDELTLITAGTCRVTVRAAEQGRLRELHFSDEGSGLHLFEVDLSDFPDAERLEVEAEGCPAIGYTPVNDTAEAVRLAWRTEQGSVEHYTFPVRSHTTLEVRRRRTASTAGIRTAGVSAQRTTTLVSACELPPVADALEGLLRAPQVWQADGDRYWEVEVMTDRAELHRRKGLCTLEVTIRPTLHEARPWSC